jgi:hypothetical protein
MLEQDMHALTVKVQVIGPAVFVGLSGWNIPKLSGLECNSHSLKLAVAGSGAVVLQPAITHKVCHIFDLTASSSWAMIALESRSALVHILQRRFLLHAPTPFVGFSACIMWDHSIVLCAFLGVTAFMVGNVHLLTINLSVKCQKPAYSCVSTNVHHVHRTDQVCCVQVTLGRGGVERLEVHTAPMRVPITLQLKSPRIHLPADIYFQRFHTWHYSCAVSGTISAAVPNVSCMWCFVAYLQSGLRDVYTNEPSCSGLLVLFWQ